MSKAWFPNALTLVRLPLAGVTIACILSEAFAAAFWLLVVAGLTDALDGLAARWLNARTPLGSYLDPIADKALLIGVFLALCATGLLPFWVVALVVARDLVILAAVSLLFAVERTIHTVSPSIISKLNTVLQIALAGTALLVHGFHLNPHPSVAILSLCVAATTIASGLGYGYRFLSRLRALSQVRNRDEEGDI